MRAKFQLAVSPALKEAIQRYGHLVNWSAVARAALTREVRKIKRIERAARAGRGRKAL